jgi:magnesium-protoporphyrin O-methyltransferase
MDCCEPTLYDSQFDARRAADRLRDYRRNGPNGWTRRLIDGLASGGVDGLTILDIGAGVGAVHHALLVDGAASAVDVDASGPYLDAARAEADRRGLGDRVAYVKGDAVAVADRLPQADLVALDRVVCCYPHMEALVRVAADRTRRRLGLVLPRDDAWIRAGVAASNRWSSLRRNPFRVHVHRTAGVLGVARASGLVPVADHRGAFWQTVILERATS